MSSPIITVENLSKRYVIGHQAAKGDGLRHAIERAVRSPLAWLRSRQQSREAASEEFWALRDVNFEVKEGEVVGIIGRNGAGKSTLLKILSRITEPTNGRIRMKGRVSSLLEVGTGFHPELTGRENIFLNGAILGMSRIEIKRKFDEIVAFSEIEKFIDTPVKRYSSGMYVRLAFAVAAHLEPEILILDEVLAVGDTSFQKKCLGKMGEVAREGRTVLFVSHNMAAIENLCHRGVLLQGGRVEFVGTQTEVLTRYLTASSRSARGSLAQCLNRTGSGEVRIVGIEFRDTYGNSIEVAAAGQDLDIYLFFESTDRPVVNIVPSVMVTTQMGAPVFLQHSRLASKSFSRLPHSGAFVCRISQLPLPASTYHITYSLIDENGRGRYVDSVEDAAEFVVLEGDYFGSGEVPPVSHGSCLVRGEWRIEADDSRPNRRPNRSVATG